MKKFIICLIALVFMGNICEARIFGRRSRGGSSYGSSQGVDTSCAQGIADAMAKKNWVGHFGLGGTGLMEGCASGPTKEYAYSHCCFAGDSSLKTVDVGYAQSKVGDGTVVEGIGGNIMEYEIIVIGVCYFLNVFAYYYDLFQNYRVDDEYNKD